MSRFAIPLTLLLVVAGLRVAGLPETRTSASGGQTATTQGAVPTGEALAIIVNRSNPVDGLSMAELRRVFMGERNHWSNDRRITIVMREPGEPERQAMLRDVYRMDEGALKNHFLHGLFTGEILVSPKILASAVGVRKFVFYSPGAIGYVRLSDVDDSVKVIRVDELLPDDKKYKLRVEVHTGD